MEFKEKKTWGPLPRYDRVRAYERRDFTNIFIAGPCFIESEEMLESIARKVSSLGATHLRGGLFRAGTYPPEKMGWSEGKLIHASQIIANDNGLKNVIELLDISSPMMVDYIIQNADCLQVGARQMQNYPLLKICGESKKRVFLKRSPGATLDEWLGAAEYILKFGGDPVLIERGSVSHVNHVRWDLSISMIPAVKALTAIPIIVDASHGTGRRDLVEPMTLAGLAAGADGCLVEVHEDPEKSLSDSDQAIHPVSYEYLITKAKRIIEAR